MNWFFLDILENSGSYKSSIPLFGLLKILFGLCLTEKKATVKKEIFSCLRIHRYPPKYEQIPYILLYDFVPKPRKNSIVSIVVRLLQNWCKIVAKSLQILQLEFFNCSERTNKDTLFYKRPVEISALLGISVLWEWVSCGNKRPVGILYQ